MNKVNLYNLFLSFQHALTDCVSALVVLCAIKYSLPSFNNVLILVLIYNFIAFGTQFMFGYQSDKKSLAQLYVIMSIVIALVSVLTIHLSPTIPILLVGSANSLFHVGGGSIVLKTSRYKATWSGIFIAPGALGLLIGTLYAYSDSLRWLVIVLLLICFFINWYFYKYYNYQKTAIAIERINGSFKTIVILFVCLFGVVILRSLIGITIPFPWKSTLPYAVTLITAFIFVGKILGGIIAEKNGLVKTGLISLCLSIPLILVGIKIPLIGMLGLLLFQMTTAITLVLIYSLFPNNPGTSFGFTTLALFIGALPMLTDNINIIKGSVTVGVLGILAIILMFFVSYVLTIAGGRKQYGK